MGRGASTASWHEIAAFRAHDVRMRLVFAVFIALAGAISHRGAVWPLVWLAAAVAAQALTFIVARPVLKGRSVPPSPRRQAAVLACVALSASTFAAAGALFWFLGGWGGRLFAVIFMAGGALSVAMQAGASARLLWAGCGPFLLVLQALPLISLMAPPEDEHGVMLMTAFAATLFVAHLAAAGRRSIASARKVERALRDARAERMRAEAASAAKSDFLAVMSHELRTPLNGVLGMAQAMAGDQLSRAQRERLAVLRRSSETLLTQLNDVLEIAKREAAGPGVSREAAEVAVRALDRPPSSAAPQALLRGGERLRVLAADDNPTNQLVLKTLLEQLGVAVHVVGGGQEAIDAWRAAPWDLVLMDIRMPGVDGVAATRAIRAEEAASGRPRTPIVAVTADAAAAQAADYFSLGMDGLVPKPIQLAQLVAIMMDALAEAPDAAMTAARSAA